jgi:uncharacterized phage protein gp47/JayE
MPLSTPIQWQSGADLKRQFLEDIELQCVDAGIDSPPVNRGTHWDLSATSTANIGSVLVFNQQMLDKDGDPTRAEGDALEEWRIKIGLPEVPPSVSSGEITTVVIGVGTIPVGLQFTAPNGFRAKTITAATGTGLLPVSAEMLDVGEDGDIDTGTKVKFNAPPPNVLVDATVTSAFTGGTSTETDTKKRDRVLNRLRNPPGGGNWSQIREIAMSASGAVSGAYCYPALGGPGSMKVVVTSTGDATNRAITSTMELDKIRSAIANEFPEDLNKYVVQSVANLPVSVGVGLDLPIVGSGAWLASGPRRPAVVIGTLGTLLNLQAATSGDVINNVAVGDTVAYWSVADQRFYTSTVTVVYVTATGLCNFDHSPWLDGGTGPLVGEWVCPACDGIVELGAAWLAAMIGLGPGENVASSNPRFTRAYRHPAPSAGNPHSLTNVQLAALQEAQPAITGSEYLLRSPVSTPTVPALLMDAPNCLTLANFGVYPL